MEKIKILQVTGSLGIGGVEKMAVSFLEKIDRNKFQIDYLVYGEQKGKFEDKVLSLGGNIWRIPNPSEGYYKFYKNVCKVLKENGPYDIVHTHVLFNSGFIVRAASKNKVPIRIAHSHDNLNYLKDNMIRKIYYYIMRKWLIKYSTKFCACSTSAGEYLFGKEEFEKKGELLYNAIDVKNFTFNAEKRTEIRKQLNIENEKIIGNIGRLETQKNQEYLLEVFKEIKKSSKDYKLLLVGDGSLKSELQQKVEEMQLEKDVMMLGNREDICSLLSAMDVFVLPSIHEGLGIVLIEAQANGLACIAPKNVVPIEAKILNNFKFMPTPNMDNLEEWIDAVKESAELDRISDVEQIIKKAGYDADTIGERLVQLYK